MLKVDFPTAKASAAATKEIVDQLCKVCLIVFRKKVFFFSWHLEAMSHVAKLQ
jgi:hypothetical protein